MQKMPIGELLRDFRSIKLPKDKRTFVDMCRKYLESNGALPHPETLRLREMERRYSKQFKALYEARDRARTTNGLKAMGMTRAEAQERSQARRARKADQNADLGF